VASYHHDKKEVEIKKCTILGGKNGLKPVLQRQTNLIKPSSPTYRGIVHLFYLVLSKNPLESQSELHDASSALNILRFLNASESRQIKRIALSRKGYEQELHGWVQYASN